jgi:hypothetical protein
MLEALQAEGHQINDRELMRVRLRFHWFLREARAGAKKRGISEPTKTQGKSKRARVVKKTKVVPGYELINQLGNAILQDTSSEEEDTSGDENVPDESESEPELEPTPEPEPEIPARPETESQQAPLDPEEALRRQLRQQQLQLESDEKWRTRTRRRRIRGWAGLPADAPGEPPRFPSETTIDESKAYLSLDNKLYKEMRAQFQAICKEQGVMKKTIAGPEKWAQLLQRLIHENDHLSYVFRQESESLQQSDAMGRPKNNKSLSLDVICQDVTKRMRVLETHMGVHEAKNALGLNPAQTRQLRAALVTILKAAQFTNIFEVGDEHWNALKQKWVQESEHLRHAIHSGGEQADPQHAERLKAIDVLARDVMKRFQSQTSKKQVHKGPGPGPAAPSTKRPPKPSNAAISQQSSIPTSFPHSSNTPATKTTPDFEIDPSLLLAASGASTICRASNCVEPTQHHPNNHVAQTEHQPNNYVAQTQHQLRTHRPLENVNLHPSVLPSGPMPIYFRLHHLSNTNFPHKSVWLSILQAGNLAEIKTLAMREHPGTIVVKLEGVIAHGGGGGESEVAIAIDDDDELNAFLGHVRHGKATFVVLLGWGGSSVKGGYM